jgi:hypothetical protein
MNTQISFHDGAPEVHVVVRSAEQNSVRWAAVQIGANFSVTIFDQGGLDHITFLESLRAQINDALKQYENDRAAPALAATDQEAPAHG